jgi:hypothetical protein
MVNFNFDFHSVSVSPHFFNWTNENLSLRFFPTLLREEKIQDANAKKKVITQKLLFVNGIENAEC